MSRAKTGSEDQSRTHGFVVREEDVATRSPLLHEHQHARPIRIPGIGRNSHARALMRRVRGNRFSNLLVLIKWQLSCQHVVHQALPRHNIEKKPGQL